MTEDWEVASLNLTRAELRVLGSEPGDRNYSYEQEFEMRRALPGLAARGFVEIVGDGYRISPALGKLLPALRELEQAARALEPGPDYSDWEVLNESFKKSRAEAYCSLHGVDECSCNV